VYLNNVMMMCYSVPKQCTDGVLVYLNNVMMMCYSVPKKCNDDVLQCT
jgi:hypothetical protein